MSLIRVELMNVTIEKMKSEKPKTKKNICQELSRIVKSIKTYQELSRSFQVS